jgi:acyl phosphate:glycerol-3-phosphate acyltransferase
MATDWLVVSFWSVLGFVLGAIPFSPLIGRLALGKDIEQYGDKNPGATNVLRAGGFLWFSLALALDISKGAAPVGLAYQIFGVQDWRIVPIALAPPLGHVFSPFLGWRGGKAIAATFGVWIGLTIWKVPLIGLVLLLFWFGLLTVSGWAVLLTLVGILVSVFIWLPDPVLIGVTLTQIALLVWTHRADLRQRPRLRILQRKGG